MINDFIISACLYNSNITLTKVMINMISVAKSKNVCEKKNSDFS